LASKPTLTDIKLTSRLAGHLSAEKPVKPENSQVDMQHLNGRKSDISICA
jgi:hypothetical protein